MKVYLNNIICYTIGLVFILSGFVKLIDPFGFSLKVTDYLKGYAFIPEGINLAIAILLPALELWLGVMLSLNLWRKAMSSVIALIMTGFTIVTAYLAFSPYAYVQECGCFGDAFVISNEASFYKNIMLLLGAVLVFYFACKTHTKQNHKRNCIVGIYFMIIALAIPTYSLTKLPPFDFLAYNRGCDLTKSRDFRIYDKDSKKQPSEVLAVSSTPIVAIVKQEQLSPTEEQLIEPLRKLQQQNKVRLITLGMCNSVGTENYYVNDVTTKSLIRAESGILLIENGIVHGKWRLTERTANYFSNNKDIEVIKKEQSSIVYKFWGILLLSVIVGIGLVYCMNIREQTKKKKKRADYETICA